MRRGPEREARLPALALQNRDIRNVVAGFAGVTGDAAREALGVLPDRDVTAAVADRQR